ncbi:30S ribosomal protein S3 [Candidatus Mycoplasma mahonii]|uniref:30S ribosomal protein S3 n=1 Tax=Candidatus Mycoplasma mahonii TaxID=3004105 RepID=UPI0026EFD853|nr:30S ribosomal protein S3 [Candidatus Mycoplasma mahonii]WKX02247.1 30S ribosomal protein S3 [Candidatus Mycoplasma mahonii]
MGQKVNPNGFRFGITKKHNSTWFADKYNFATLLLEDQKIREYIEPFTRQYAIGQIEISRNQANDVMVIIHSAKPGVILGEGGKNLETFKKAVQKHTRNKQLKLSISVIAIERPELNARLAAEDIAIKLENRGSFRAAQKWSIRSALKAGAKGIKTQVSGRLNGADMARSEGYTEGEMKLHTLRQDVDFAKATAKTTYGAIGIKVWISKGEILDGGNKNVATKKN